MLSRVADGMFWLNRYMERADGMLLTLNTFILCLLIKKQMTTKGINHYENYTNLSPEVILKYNTIPPLF
jgi:uncharacterized alpha-E superfamily protein